MSYDITPTVGRFINSDDVAMLIFSQDEVLRNNIYSYCENAPITNIDFGGYVKINIKWVWWTVDIIIWLVPALVAIANVWSSTMRSASKLYNFGMKLINFGKKILTRLDNRIYWAFARENTYRLIKTIGILAGFITIFSSIGTMIQYIIDILDGKWDGYLNTSNIRPKFDLTRDY